MSKKTLLKTLASLHGFESYKDRLEQYETNPDIAAEMLWELHMKEGLQNKEIIDLGCGPGILGIGCILLGSKKVTFIDVDNNVQPTLQKNLRKIKSEFEVNTNTTFLCKDVAFIKEMKSDIVVQNPPFGTKTKGKDILFLDRAFEMSNTVLSIHKTTTKKYVKDHAEKKGYFPHFKRDYKFPLQKTRKRHNKAVEHIYVTGFIFKS